MHTSTNEKLSLRHRLILAFTAFALAAAGVMAMPPPAEAATLTATPSATCGQGTVRVNHGLQTTAPGGENIAIAYTIQKWTGSSWANYKSYSYLQAIYPYGITSISPTIPVSSGYYRVVLALKWYQYGSLKNGTWAPVNWYHQPWGTTSQGWCTVS